MNFPWSLVFTKNVCCFTSFEVYFNCRGLSDLPQSYTGQTINSDDFQQSYVKPLTKDSNLVVFLQDRVSYM